MEGGHLLPFTGFPFGKEALWIQSVTRVGPCGGRQKKKNSADKLHNDRTKKRPRQGDRKMTEKVNRGWGAGKENKR